MRMGFSSLVYQDDVTVARQFEVRQIDVLEHTQRDTGEERRLGQADEEATHGEASATSHGRHADCGRTPRHHHGRKKPSWVCLCKPQVTRKLANEIANVEG
jgi:ABC-type Zn2+ transport system substrate-binding protein/surface adhesin